MAFHPLAELAIGSILLKLPGFSEPISRRAETIKTLRCVCCVGVRELEKPGWTVAYGSERKPTAQRKRHVVAGPYSKGRTRNIGELKLESPAAKHRRNSQVRLKSLSR